MTTDSTDNARGPDLLPCPFCGGEAEIVEAEEAGPQAYVVACKGCMSCSRVIFALMDGVGDELVTAWNRRDDLAPDQLGAVKVKPDVPACIVEYTNYRGETARRVIIPVRMWWGCTEWHPEEQWMLTAWDVEKDAVRDFAWQDMKPVQNGATSEAARIRSALEPDPQDARVAALVDALKVYTEPCDGNEHEPCGYEGSLCCKTARAALAVFDKGGKDDH